MIFKNDKKRLTLAKMIFFIDIEVKTKGDPLFWYSFAYNVFPDFGSSSKSPLSPYSPKEINVSTAWCSNRRSNLQRKFFEDGSTLLEPRSKSELSSVNTHHVIGSTRPIQTIVKYNMFFLSINEKYPTFLSCGV